MNGSRPELNVLFEDNHLIAVNKPCGMPSTHFDGGEETLDLRVKEYLRDKYQKPGNVFLGVVHRLDKPVSGVLLFARTSKAAARLSEQFRLGTVEKNYWAVVDVKSPESERLLSESGVLEDHLFHDDAGHLVKVVPSGTSGAKPAKLSYVVKSRHGRMVWLELTPDTGRKHQLRVQLASRGLPILGDRKYGSTTDLGKAIALHARQLTFQHPVSKESVTLMAEPPRAFRDRFAALMNPDLR